MFFILFLLFYFLTDSETETSPMPDRGGNARAEGNQEGSVTGETPWIGHCNTMLNSH